MKRFLAASLLFAVSAVAENLSGYIIDKNCAGKAASPPVPFSSGKVDARVQDESALPQVRVQHVRGGRFWRKQSQLIASACRDGRSVDLISPPVAAL